MTYPTGEQYEIDHGDQQAVVTEVGATLRTYRIGDRPVVLGSPPPSRCRPATASS